MVELQVITNCILKNIPTPFYLGLISLFFLGIIILLWRKGLKDGLRHGTVLLFAEWIIFVLGMAVIFRGNCAERSINLVPLSSYFDYGEHSYLMEKVALNILNVALFVPVGLLLGCGFRAMSWKKTIIIGVTLSVSIELLQLIFCKGLCEIDDVIHNVLGCMIGYGIYRIIKWMLYSPKFLLKVTCVIIMIVLLRQFYFDICSFPNLFDNNIYESYGVSDWLINYRGGFVRRGLAGEILWQLYQLHPFSVVHALIFLNLLFLGCLSVLCIILFHRMGWPLWLLLFPMFLYYRFYGVGMGILDSRRDGLILLLAFLLFSQYKKCFSGKGISILWILSFLTLFFYEGIFFLIFPFLILHTWMSYKATYLKRYQRIMYLWWPVAVVLFVLIFKYGGNGDENISEIIWQSWEPCFVAFPFGSDLPSIGPGVEFLSKTLRDNHPLAFSIAWKSNFIGSIPGWPFNLYTLLALYYLITRMDVMGKPFQHKQRIQISNILLIQLFFTLPMLGLIADDWYRSIPDCCITTCFLCYLFPEHSNIPQFVDDVSIRIQKYLDRKQILNNPWTYYVVLVSLPLCLYNARPGGMFPFIPIDIKHRLLEALI